MKPVDAVKARQILQGFIDFTFFFFYIVLGRGGGLFGGFWGRLRRGRGLGGGGGLRHSRGLGGDHRASIDVYKISADRVGEILNLFPGDTFHPADTGVLQEIIQRVVKTLVMVKVDWMVTLCSPAHLLNASPLISVTLAGIVISRREGQSANIQKDNAVIPSAIVTVSSFAQPLNKLIALSIAPLIDAVRRLLLGRR